MASVIRGNDNFDSGWGNGQTWQDVTASRAFYTTYTNTTGKPIEVAVTLGGNGSQFDAQLVIYVDELMVVRNGPSSGATGLGYPYSGATVIVPNGSTYRAERGSYGTSLQKWTELR